MKQQKTNNWQTKKLGEVSEIRSGKNQKKVVNPNGKYPIYGSSGIFGYADSYISEANTTIIGRKGTINNPIYVTEKFWNVDTAFGLHSKEELNSKYLFYFCKSFNFHKLDKSTTIPSLSKTDLQSIEIPIPPLETQHAIVSKIEELFSELDKGIAELKTAQQQLKTYRQSVLKYAFEGKLTNENVKDGELPDGWEWKTIKEISTLLGDGLHGTPKYDSNGEYYFINGNNLNDGKIEIKENTKKVSKEEFEKYKKQLNNKTIFVSINGSLGYTAFYNDEPIILGKSACYINIKEGIDKHYIRYIFTSQRFTNYSISVATGSTIKNVSLKSMREFEVPLPETIGEQHRIVQEIESRLSVADKMEQSIQESLQKAEALRQSILKKAFSGELV